MQTEHAKEPEQHPRDDLLVEGDEKRKGKAVEERLIHEGQRQGRGKIEKHGHDQLRQLGKLASAGLCQPAPRRTPSGHSRQPRRRKRPSAGPPTPAA